jgi:hypothetical protein
MWCACLQGAFSTAHYHEELTLAEALSAAVDPSVSGGASSQQVLAALPGCCLLHVQLTAGIVCMVQPDNVVQTRDLVGGHCPSSLLRSPTGVLGGGAALLAGTLVLGPVGKLLLHPVDWCCAGIARLRCFAHPGSLTYQGAPTLCAHPCPGHTLLDGRDPPEGGLLQAATVAG